MPIIYIKLLNVFNNLIRYTPSGLCFLRFAKMQKRKNAKVGVAGMCDVRGGFSLYFIIVQFMFVFPEFLF